MNVPRPATRARLVGAAVLSAVPLGVVWSRTADRFVLPYHDVGTCYNAEEGTLCREESYTPGSYTPGARFYGHSLSPRLFLVFAAVALIVCAVVRRTRRTLLLARAATVAMAAAAAQAAAYRSVIPLAALTLALVLVVPLVLRPGLGRHRRLLAPGVSSG